MDIQLSDQKTISSNSQREALRQRGVEKRGKFGISPSSSHHKQTALLLLALDALNGITDHL